MKTKLRRRGRKAGRLEAPSDIPCSYCAKTATTVCAGCERPICKDHTILIRVGPPGGDVLNLEICGSCSETKYLAHKAASG